MALAAHLAAWPEGQEAREALVRWCKDEGVPPPCPDRIGHRDKSDDLMLGFGLVTRPIPANSKEWKSIKGQEAIITEMGEHAKRGTWNMNSVRELDDILKEARQTGEETVLGGVHPILGAKGAEDCEEKDLDLRCRVVFTAPRAWTASGMDVHSLYQEISASPITFQGSRTLRAYAALMGFVISSRDAKSAYLQSKLRREGMNDPRTWVALPRQFWPKEWEGMIRPMVELDLSLYGHPIAGNRWDGTMDTAAKACAFERAPQWKSVYRQKGTGAGMGVYVDDFEVMATEADTPKIWAELEKHIEFGAPHKVWKEDDTRHLACQYKVFREKQKDGEIEMTIKASMPNYFRDIVNRFEKRMGVEIMEYHTP